MGKVWGVLKLHILPWILHLPIYRYTKGYSVGINF